MTRERIYQLSRYGNLLAVSAAVGGQNDTVRKFKLLVDTGSSYTVLRSNLLNALGCDLQNLLRTIRITTGGGIVEVPVVTVPWFGCLGQRLGNFPLVAYTLPATTFVDGLLGMDFLSRFRVTISVKDAEIRYRQ